MSKQVIVLHGLAMNRLWMTGLSRHLKNGGYDVHALSYPSRDKPLDKLVEEHIAPAVDAAALKSGGKVDFVVHSLGGILTRLYAQRYGADKIGRVVMIGTPNRGSEVADALRKFPPFEWYFGAVGPKLGTTAEDIHASLPPVNFDCGVIAGENHFLHFPTSYLINIPRPNDGIVSVESTKVEGMKDHITLFADHSQMAWMPSVWKLAAGFLADGKFPR